MVEGLYGRRIRKSTQDLVSNTNSLDIVNETFDDLPDVCTTATIKDIALGKTAYINGIKITGTYEPGVGEGLKVYVQEEEPEEYNGIWIESAEYEYENVIEIDSKIDVEISSINIVKGNVLSTLMCDSSLTYRFNEIYITDEEGEIIYDTNVYYGDGEKWIDITPLDPSKGFVGIRADFVNGTVTRLEGSVSVNALKCYSGRRRCNMQDDGTITAYYGEANYDNVGNENLQVMVEQPKAYYSLQNVTVDSNGNITKADYMISDVKVSNQFEVHPAFISNGIEYDKVYVGAYEGIVVNNKLSSIGGGTSAPTTSKTRANFRTYANNRGNIWRQLTIQYQHLENLMLAIEYVNFNLQSVLSNGNIGGSLQNVGYTYTLNADGTGLRGGSISAINCFTWRWRENPYGNVSKCLDGINVNTNNWYIKDNNFQDTTAEGHILLSETCAPPWGGHITRFAYVENAKWIFMPKTTAGSSTGIIRDYFYHGNGWRIVEYGGRYAITTGDGGPFALDVAWGSGDSYNWLGAGLLAMPTSTI